MSHFLEGAYDQIVRWDIKKTYRQWLDRKIQTYRDATSLGIVGGDKAALRELIEDQEYSAHTFIQEFKDGRIKI